MKILKPMEPILSKKIPIGEEWIHQIKWDGIRGLTYINSNNIKIFTKKGNDHTDNYPEVQQLTKLFHGYEAVLDGELVVFDSCGRPSFSNVLIRDRIYLKEKYDFYLTYYPVKYIVFDILYLNGNDLRNRQYYYRKELLTNFISKDGTITITDDFEDGKALFHLMEDQGFEGIVSKRNDSIYKEGKGHEDWFKIKLNKKVLVVVGGISLKNNYPSALIVGIYRNNQLEAIGKVATGLKNSDYELLHRYIDTLKSPNCPFINLKNRKDYIWFEPNITCWIKFMDWTSSGSLRHPTLIGFSNIKPGEANGLEIIVD